MYVFYHNGVTPYNAELKHITDAKGDWAYPAGLIEQGQGLRTTSHQPPTVLFFGDSHVEAFGPRIVDMYRKGLIQEVGFITSGGCAPIPNVFAGNTYINKCTLNLDNFEKALSSHSIHTIIIGGSYHAYLLGGKSSFYMQGDEKILSSTDNGYEKALQSFYTFVQELSKKNTVIVLSHAAASEKFSPQNMIHSTLDGQRTLPLKLKLQNTPFSIDTSLEEKMKADIEALGITFVSQSQKVCPEGICYP